MNENEKRIDVVDSQTGNDTDNIDYISAINEIKRNSVNRESYDKLKAENSRLLDALVQGKNIELPVEEKVDIDQLRKDLYNRNGHLSNLEYIDKTLKLRDALIENGERDPFVGFGEKLNITAEMYDNAERVAGVLKECVEFADGDSGIFTAELQRRTKEVMPKYGRK